MDKKIVFGFMAFIVLCLSVYIILPKYEFIYTDTREMFRGNRVTGGVEKFYMMSGRVVPITGSSIKGRLF